MIKRVAFVALGFVLSVSVAHAQELEPATGEAVSFVLYLQGLLTLSLGAALAWVQNLVEDFGINIDGLIERVSSIVGAIIISLIATYLLPVAELLDGISIGGMALSVLASNVVVRKMDKKE